MKKLLALNPEKLKTLVAADKVVGGFPRASGWSVDTATNDVCVIPALSGG
jgi:hypothetical protein